MEVKQSFKDFDLDLTPEPSGHGSFIACAKLSRRDGGHVEELLPDYAPFATEAEAVAAAHAAAIAWIAAKG